MKKNFATGVDHYGIPHQITVGDKWEARSDSQLTCEITDYNGQWFEAVMTNHSAGNTMKVRITDFNDFINQWGLVRHGVTDYGSTPLDSANYKLSYRIEGEAPTNPRCECGNRALGSKDYTRQHSSWCPVYRE